MHLDQTLYQLSKIEPHRIFGCITDIHGMSIIGTAPHKKISVGSRITIEKNNAVYHGEVIAMEDASAVMLLADPVLGLSIGDHIHYHMEPLSLTPSPSWIGRIIDGFGYPLDQKGVLYSEHKLSTPRPTRAQPIHAMERATISKSLDVGIRALNTFVPICHGQRLGIFAGSGVGKSVLLSMLTRFTACDVCIIGMIGERGREVREFIENTLGTDGLRKSIVVVATSDAPPLARRQAAYTTLTLAEYFRDQGQKVLCMIDSLTRFAMAQREIGLSAGEPPTTKGYPPSTFFELAQLCERAGPGYRLDTQHNTITPGGHITGLFTVLVDGDDTNEPISDAVRGILDGHILLNRNLAERGHYPAIDVLKSLSRLTDSALSSSQKNYVREARRILSTYHDMEDLIRLGAYQAGHNAEVDRAIALYPAFEKFLQQKAHEHTDIHTTFEALKRILGI